MGFLNVQYTKEKVMHLTERLDLYYTKVQT